jgi:putative PEP-CTERM system TPR-repeat lipoprotein
MTSRSFVVALFIATSLYGLPSWSEDPARAAQYYEDALKRYENQDDAGAIIQLKNALQQDTTYLSAYLLMGQAQLRTGDLIGAEASLTTALRMGADRSEVVQPLADVYSRLGKHQELLDKIQVAGLPAPIALDIWLSRAYAHLSLADFPGAEYAIDQAAAIDSKAGGIYIARGHYHLQRGNLSAASQFADQAVRLATDDPRGWNLKASIAHSAGNSKIALADYARALELRPNFIDVRIARAGLLLDLNRLEDAFQDLTHLKKISPEEPRAAYLRSVYFSRKGDGKSAKAELLLSAKVLGTLPPAFVNGKPQLLMLGALTNYGIQAYEQAQSFAEGYIKLKPDDPGARKLLANILLARGSVDAAIRHLEQANRAAPKDPQILNMLANSYLAKNQYAKAANLLEQAGTQTFQTSDLSKTLGFSLIGLDRPEQGILHLNSAFTKNPSDLRLGSSLAMLNIQRGQAKEAVRVAEAYLARHPRDPAAFNLIGVTKSAARDLRGARAAYGKAIELAPQFHTARLNLGKLEVSERRYDAARQHFQAVLKLQPKNALALYEMALLERAASRPGEATRLLQVAISQAPSNTTMAIELSNLYLAQGMADKAVETAKQIANRYPDDPRVLAVLGKAYASAGQTNLAKSSFANMSKQAGFDNDLLMQTARLQLDINDLDGASASINKVLFDSPGAIEANALMTRVELRRSLATKALERARTLVAANPKAAMAQSALGEVALATRNTDEAVRAYKTALDISDSAENVLNYYRAMSNVGNLSGGRKVLQSWTQRHPNVGAVELVLAEAWLQEGELTKARTSYEDHLKRYGDSPVTLNNLANILSKQGDPKALDFAERAYRLAPTSPIVNDTLGWLLTQKGETERALRYLREAKLRAPHSPEVRYHLAVCLGKSGRNKEAASEVAQALHLSAKFEGIEDARLLQQRLRTP